MRISILTSYFYFKIKEVHGEDRVVFSGADRYLYDLAMFLQNDLGHEVIVYQAMDVDRIIEKDFRGMKIVCLPVKNECDYYTNPNLNIAFYDASYTSDLRIFFATFLAFPYVKLPAISINHGVFWDFPGSIYSLATEEQKKEFFRRQLFGISSCNYCVGVDTNIKNFIAAYSPEYVSKIVYIPNYADTSIFYPRQEPKNWDRPRILFPRRLDIIRGINEFLNAATTLPDYDFILCGNANNEKEGEIVKKSISLPNVKLIEKDMNEMAEVYREVDIAVIPTRAAEGTSLSCIEAMASGLPVITTLAGGLPDLVIDGYNGFLVDTYNQEISPYIKVLIDYPQLAKKMGERNVEIVKSSFDKEIWKRKWINLLNKVL